MTLNPLYIPVCAGLIATYVVAVILVARVSSASMRRRSTLSKNERPIVLATLVDVSCQRAAEDREFLRDFLDGYLGNALAAKRQAWDRAIDDANSTREMFTDSCEQMSDEQLLASLVRSEKYIPSHDTIGFDPRARLFRISESNRLFSDGQTRVTLLGFGVIILMLLIPPWIRQEDNVTWTLWSVDSRDVTSEKFLGYRFVLSPRLPPNEIERISNGNLGQTRQKRKRNVVALRFLLPQVFVAIGSAAIAVRQFASSTQFEADSVLHHDPPAEDDTSSPSECLVCGEIIPFDADCCQKSGWSYR
ncbi:hypothetical protein SH139x_003194 [Planctomycetaceae bacterium SH139]